MPVSWLVAFVVVWLILSLLAVSRGLELGEFLEGQSGWIVAVILPGVLFGKILGMMLTNLITFLITRTRGIFTAEADETGRHGFFAAMRGLSIAAGALGLVTAVGCIAFLRFSP